MPEVIQQHHAPGPVTLKVNTPGLPLHVAVADDITHAHVHVVGDGDSSIDLGQTGGTLTVTSGGTPDQRPPSLLSRFFGGSRASSGSVRASGRGSIAAGGSIQNCAIGNGSVVQVGGSIRTSASGGAVASGGDLTLGGPVEPKVPGVYVDLPSGSRVTVKAAARVEVNDPSLLADFTE